MTWDFVETNPFAGAGGDIYGTVFSLCEVLQKLAIGVPGTVKQHDASSGEFSVKLPLLSFDPPYYDNIGYADLSDFFYVWLRHSLSNIYPSLFGTMLVPKAQELVADPIRHGSKTTARHFFEHGIGRVFEKMCNSTHPDFPVTIYYAFKQSETEQSETDMSDDRKVTASTGWETMLKGLIDAGFQISGTWPIRSELSNRMIASGTNALASSIVLVCRPRAKNASIATRREFITALRNELEGALIKMMHGNIAPVDLAQATIGPGMAVYSRYSKVIETNGEPLRVRTALQIINHELDAILSATEGDYDVDTRFCLSWFDQFGLNSGAFGNADNMARAKNTSVAGLAESGVLASGAGKVRLLKREEYPAEWNPQTDVRKPVWECTQYLVRALQERGEGGAAQICAALGGAAEPARDLAYRLYSICERKGWAQEALAYNSLVIAWPEITQLASNPNILGSNPQTAMRMED